MIKAPTGVAEASAAATERLMKMEGWQTPYAFSRTFPEGETMKFAIDSGRALGMMNKVKTILAEWPEQERDKMLLDAIRGALH